MTRSTKRVRRTLLVALTSMALVAAACGDDDDDAGSAPDTTTEAGGDTTAAGGSEDSSASGGDQDLSGETVNIQGSEVGTEAEGAEAGYVPVEERTGVDVVFSGSRDFETNIRVAAEGGSLPDIALFPQPGLVTDETFVDLITPLPDDVVATAKENFDPVWTDLVTVDGNVLAVPVKADVKSLVWYSPPAFEEAGYEVPETWDDLITLQDQMREDGGTPWCIGIESGEATGWPFTDWVEDVMLRLNGPEVYDQWRTHEIPFNDPQVKAAVEEVTDIWFEDGNVLGGQAAIASTGFGAAGLPVLDGDCYMHRQGNFFSANFKSADPDVTFGEDGDINVFYLPTMSDEFGTVMLSAGNYAVAFNDRPATLAVMASLADPEYPNARIEANKGGFISPNKNHDTSLYADELDRTMAGYLAEADVVRFDASDLMPPEVGTGTFWKDGTNYVSGAEDIDTFLDNVEASWPN